MFIWTDMNTCTDTHVHVYSMFFFFRICTYTNLKYEYIYIYLYTYDIDKYIFSIHQKMNKQMNPLSDFDLAQHLDAILEANPSGLPPTSLQQFT